MQNPYFELTVPIFKKSLTTLDGLLTKALTHAHETGMSEEMLLEQKLAPDMFVLSRQVQIATDNAKGATARLCGIDAPVMEDNETSIAQLKERITKTIAFLDTLTPEQFADADSRTITLRYYEGKHFLAQNYLTEYAIPNFFFHVTVAYAILRSVGAEIGKADYLGELNMIND